MTRILVYGTLRQGERAHGALRTAKFVEEGRVPGFDMYSVGGFPGIVQNERNKEGIAGEVYEVDKNTLEHLDAYEGYRPSRPAESMYVRRSVNVNGTPTDLYVWNREVSNFMQPIRSGNWKER